ncbi:MAG: Crp/Fnr family transcriptional regulator [Methylococcaceae bacterium]|nr:Crp/Fnr family transcriptional regulator [Methylococcaceae bacterium]
MTLGTSKERPDSAAAGSDGAVLLRKAQGLVDTMTVDDNVFAPIEPPEPAAIAFPELRTKLRVHQDILASLKIIPFLSEIADAVLAKLAEGAVVKNFPKNVVIINEGDEAGPLFILLSGKVRVFLSNQEGRTVILSEQRAGSYLGELSLLDHEPRSASVMTLEPTTCALIPKQVFTDWVRDYPEDAGLAMIRGLTKRIRMLTDNVRSLALSDVYGRLVKVLQDLAVADPEREGEWLVEGKFSHQELANLVGASREMVSRILKDLTKGGYVINEGKKIRILKRLPASW